ncbi:MAG: DUF4292 domain-containing protein [Bacteroidales bacterium]|jgi:hypothetical protein|nr:DUF4292 domain-containing protein [Bacteroidales bacterium]
MSGQKLNIVLLVMTVIISASCQSLRIKGGRSGKEAGAINAGRFLAEMKSTNITGQPISISRITITYENSYEKRRLRANAKMNGKGDLLVSVRTFAGIEAARILIGRDTVKVADRINRICYIGETKELEKKYGVKYNFINLLFGDFLDVELTRRRIMCEGGIAVLDDFDRGLEYKVDCSIYKLVEAAGRLDEDGEEIKGVFSEFRAENGLIYPGSIEWDLGVNNTKIEMQMQNIRKDDNDELVFKVGDSYRVKKLR